MISRFFISFISDKYGIRITYSILLLIASIIGILKILLIEYTTISRVLTGLYGILGGSFVLSETWVIRNDEDNYEVVLPYQRIVK